MAYYLLKSRDGSEHYGESEIVLLMKYIARSCNIKVRKDDCFWTSDNGYISFNHQKIILHGLKKEVLEEICRIARPACYQVDGDTKMKDISDLLKK